MTKPRMSANGYRCRAKQEAGVVVVFAIVFIVACGLIGLWISKCLSARKAKKVAAANAA